MKNITILKVYFGIYLVSCFILMLANLELIMRKDTSGILFLSQLTLFGIMGLLLDWVLIRTIKNKKIFHGLELLIIVIFTIVVWNEL